MRSFSPGESIFYVLKPSLSTQNNCSDLVDIISSTTQKHFVHSAECNFYLENVYRTYRRHHFFLENHLETSADPISLWKIHSELSAQPFSIPKIHSELSTELISLWKIHSELSTELISLWKIHSELSAEPFSIPKIHSEPSAECNFYLKNTSKKTILVIFIHTNNIKKDLKRTIYYDSTTRQKQNISLIIRYII